VVQQQVTIILPLKSGTTTSYNHFAPKKWYNNKLQSFCRLPENISWLRPCTSAWSCNFSLQASIVENTQLRERKSRTQLSSFNYNDVYRTLARNLEQPRIQNIHLLLHPFFLWWGTAALWIPQIPHGFQKNFQFVQNINTKKVQQKNELYCRTC